MAFKEMDANADGKVTLEEFVQGCCNQESIAEMLAIKMIGVVYEVEDHVEFSEQN